MGNSWVDFRLIKQSVTMQMVLEHYGINGLRKNGSELRGPCPIHKGEGNRTFQVNVNKNVFQCFSCKARGNILDFVAALESCTVRDAALKLSEWFAVGENGQIPNALPGGAIKAETGGVETEPAAPINPPLQFRLTVDFDHEYGKSRGLSRETLEYFGAGFCRSKGTFAGRFIIPLHDVAGAVIGYAGRSIDERDPKYLFPSSEKHFYKSHLLYNLHRVVANAPADGVVILVEGFFGTMWLHQSGFPNVVSLLGSSLSEHQEELLCRHFRRVFLLFDGDDAGRSVTDACLQRLARHLWVRALSLEEGTQPDDLSATELADLPKQIA